MRCRDRDRIILAFALAMKDTNEGYAKLEGASEDQERGQALATIETSQDHCYRLRELVVRHCVSHGC